MHAKLDSAYLSYLADVLRPEWPAMISRAKSIELDLGEISEMSVEEAITLESAPFWACSYATYVIQGPWPLAEPLIATSAVAAYYYARDVVGRWPQAESVIARHPDAAYRYARDVVRGRWAAGEPTIAQCADVAVAYARDVIKGRFPEGEAALGGDYFATRDYVTHLAKLDNPEYGVVADEPWDNEGLLEALEKIDF